MTNLGKNARKALGFCFALYLAVLIGVVVPTHHHEDGAEHGDCVVCVISHQPGVAPAIVSVVLVAVRLFVKKVRLPEIIIVHTPSPFGSRAPPLS